MIDQIDPNAKTTLAKWMYVCNRIMSLQYEHLSSSFGITFQIDVGPKHCR